MGNKKVKMNKKTFIAFAILAVMFITAAVSLVVVLALLQREVNANITVTYLASNVDADVDGKYWYQGENLSSLGSKVNIRSRDKEESHTISPSESINLNRNHSRVIFEYAFKNNSKTAAFTIELVNSPRIEANGNQTLNYLNMTEKYYVSSVRIPVSALNNLTSTLNGAE